MHFNMVHCDELSLKKKNIRRIWRKPKQTHAKLSIDSKQSSGSNPGAVTNLRKKDDVFDHFVAALKMYCYSS